MNQKDITSEVPHIIRHFTGKKGHYGQGDCIFWEHKVPVQSLEISKNNKKISRSSEISLSDVIEWDQLKIKSFGTKPPPSLFKVNMAWKHFCVLIVEVAYQILGLNIHEHVNHENSTNIESYNGNVIETMDDTSENSKTTQEQEINLQHEKDSTGNKDEPDSLMD